MQAGLDKTSYQPQPIIVFNEAIQNENSTSDSTFSCINEASLVIFENIESDFLAKTDSLKERKDFKYPQKSISKSFLVVSQIDENQGKVVKLLEDCQIFLGIRMAKSPLDTQQTNFINLFVTFMLEHVCVPIQDELIKNNFSLILKTFIAILQIDNDSAYQIALMSFNFPECQKLVKLVLEHPIAGAKLVIDCVNQLNEGAKDALLYFLYPLDYRVLGKCQKIIKIAAKPYDYGMQRDYAIKTLEAIFDIFLEKKQNLLAHNLLEMCKLYINKEIKLFIDSSKERLKELTEDSNL